MKIIQSVYSGDTSSTSYRKKLSDGRCRLHGVWMAPDDWNESADGSGTPPQLKFSTGNDYTDIRCQITSTVNANPGLATNYFYSGGCVYDIPSDGILFEDGIYFEGNASTYRATIFFSGGAKA